MLRKSSFILKGNVLDMFVGILLPSDLDKQCEDNFMKILKTYTEFRFKEISPCLSDEEKLRTSQKIAQLLIKGNSFCNTYH